LNQWKKGVVPKDVLEVIMGVLLWGNFEEENIPNYANVEISEDIKI
jgi:hypothetical protein